MWSWSGARSNSFLNRVFLVALVNTQRGDIFLSDFGSICSVSLYFRSQYACNMKFFI